MDLVFNQRYTLYRRAKNPTNLKISLVKEQDQTTQTEFYARIFLLFQSS